MFGHVRVGPRQQDAELRKMSSGGPHLLTRDHVLITVADRTSGQPCQVRARSGLGEQLAPHLIATQQRLKETLQLWCRAVGQQSGTHHLEPNLEVAGPDVVVALLLCEDGSQVWAEPSATLLDGPGRSAPTTRQLGLLPVRCLEPVSPVGLNGVGTVGSQVRAVIHGTSSSVRVEKPSGIETDRCLFRCVIKIHRTFFQLLLLAQVTLTRQVPPPKGTMTTKPGVLAE